MESKYKNIATDTTRDNLRKITTTTNNPNDDDFWNVGYHPSEGTIIWDDDLIYSCRRAPENPLPTIIGRLATCERSLWFNVDTGEVYK